jgi:hypothetical protein
MFGVYPLEVVFIDLDQSSIVRRDYAETQYIVI